MQLKRLYHVKLCLLNRMEEVASKLVALLEVPLLRCAGVQWPI